MLSKWILLFILPTYFMITIKVIFLNQCTLTICPICTSLICSAWFHQFWRSLWTNVGIIIMLYIQQAWLHFLGRLLVVQWAVSRGLRVIISHVMMDCLPSILLEVRPKSSIRYLLLWSDSEDVFSCEKLSEHHLVESKSIVMIGTYLYCVRAN